WIQVPQGNGIFLYNHGSSIDQPGDDRWRWLQTGRGNGNLPSNRVNCMVKDKDGFIWVGTDRGVAVFQCAEAIFSAAGCDAFQPVVQQDNFAGLLFQNEYITAMAVDGANRKWVGSRNGVWLISADGQKVIDRFTAANSPLLSNEIIRIAIDQNSGEVYFSTSKGICSYRGTATEGKQTNENVLVFPNPVPPNFGGTIAIRGVTNNAIVKIAELNGRLVHQTRALGGQAVWNGRNLRGERVASGVYLVLVADDWNQEKTVARIVFIK
ncbi:MAG: two-component regulator propeller domain-containing protein, partial [Chitinophagaceae bacterium]